MPHPKIKQEAYNSLGGINNKVSQYLNSPVEFLNLENLDFQIPGSLTQRWGSTYYVGQTLIGKVTGIQEFVKVAGESYVVVTGQTQAMTATGTSLTTFFTQVQHASFLTYQNHINATLYGFTAPWLYNLGASLNYDFQVMNNWLFAANGVDFWKFNGQSAYFYSLGQPIRDFNSGSSDLFAPSIAFTTGDASSRLTTGIYDFKISYINNRGVVGQATHRAYETQQLSSQGSSVGGGFAGIFSFGSSIFSAIEPGYGISGFQLFVAGPDQDPLPIEQRTYYICLDEATGLPFTLTNSAGATTAAGATYIFRSEDQMGLTELINWMPFGRWYIDNNNYAPDDFAFSPIYGDPPRIPRFIENYNARLWMGGMTFAPSTLFFSEDSEPEQVQTVSQREIRTSDGSGVTGLKNFSGFLIIFKENSFHALSGDPPDNLTLREISQEYGCLNNRAIAQFQDVLVFLDRKGIVQFNGSNIDLLSSKIDPILKRMNIEAARVEACLVYDKLRNEILCDIPIDGSATNNITLVYDIISHAWTTYKYGNYTPAVSAIVKGRLDNFYTFAGGYSGTVVYFGSSFINDPGTGSTASGITTVIGSRYHTEDGNSITKQYRRLFLNFTPNTGGTVPVDIQFFKDFYPISVLNRTMYQSPFQSRIDFGIPGKSLAFTLTSCSLTDKMIFHGYTLEHRFQRNV